MSSFGRGLLLGVLWMGLASPVAAVTYQVNAAAACPGSGTALAPYCSIGNAAAVAALGDAVNVAAGIYREQVTPPTSGAAGLPITYHGAAGARLYGTNNLSGAALWTLSSGTTFATPYNPPTNPAQVFVDGVALTASAAGAGAVPGGGFFYDSVADVLYVNLGGDNPGSHDVEAGARSFGFAVEGKSHLVIEGFEVRGHNTNGIRVRSSANVVVRNNRVLRAASFGLVVDSTAPATTGPVEISDNEVLDNASVGIRLRETVTQATVRGNSSHHNRSHGLLATGTTASVFENNRFFENAAPGGGSTTGLRLDSSTGNVIQRNLAYGNQDTGFQVSAGSSNNLLVRNISYANQDHGYDIRQCDVPRLVSNTAWANVNDGFSIEDNVTNAYLRNNIGSDNGLLTNGNDMWVDTSSAGGFSSDYNVFHRSSATGNTIEFNGAAYASVAAFAAATGNEANGSGGNPNFANPGAGDFHPGLGPALDSADAGASGFALLDFDGLPPMDLAGVPNTGAGVPNYADRGALERVDRAPITLAGFTTGCNANSGTSTLAINSPFPAYTGEIMLAQITFEKGSEVDFGRPGSVPGGFQLVRRDQFGSDLGQAIFAKVVTDTEPKRYAWGFEKSDGGRLQVRACGGVMVYTGVDTSALIVGSNGRSADSKTLTAPSVETEVDSMVLAFFGIKKKTSLSVPKAAEDVYFVQHANQSGPSIRAAREVSLADGSTGDRTSTAGTKEKWAAQLVSLRPADLSWPSPPAGEGASSRDHAALHRPRQADPSPMDAPAAREGPLVVGERRTRGSTIAPSLVRLPRLRGQQILASRSSTSPRAPR